ncbi:NlpC/P60 family protein [Streptomyces sp. NPDC008121]|uniref:C40 family peptidase n=1 Tax=Streptomyces sp. NPDC008121 TaxID=3364809 RepID=UPI0036E444BE
MSGNLLRTICTGAVLAATTALTVVSPVEAPGAPAAALAGAPAKAATPPVPEPEDGGGGGGGVGDEAAPVDEPIEEPGQEPHDQPGDQPGEGSAGDPAEAAAPATDPPDAEATDPPGPDDADDDAAALPPPGGDSVASLLTRLRTLYRQAEQATETYNATEEALTRHTADTRKVTDRLAAARRALAQGRDAAGRLAREQYQGRAAASALSSYLDVLLAPDPRHALDRKQLVTRAARDRAATVVRLRSAEKRADALARASREGLERERKLAGRQRKQRDDVRARLTEVERLLASLSAAQLARLTELERTQTAGAQRELLGSGVLDVRRTPSRAGAEALRHAVRQIGKPYVWGAEGPESYDCSGLTQQAWAGAGLEIPRTSQEQWRTLPKVPLDELRPGDLVVYFPEATHVAVYAGEGMVVHAPRPGGRVKVSPIAANPLLGAVRPDPGGAPLDAYAPPTLPEGATDGSDEGFDQP